MKGKTWAVLAAAVMLCVLCVLGGWLLLRPRENPVIAQARAAVESAAASGSGNDSCPVDFAALQAENADIYAWLYIPGTGINEPLVQSADDSYYYLTHDSAGEENESGALFTEAAYNQKDFSDPAVVIYGRNTSKGRLFDGLQTAYSSPEGLKEHREVIIYLPEETIRYEVFAASPFRNYHLLHYFNFNNESRYRAFLQAVDSVKTLDANRNRKVTVTPDDPLLILSTNRFRSKTMSYLVLAKRV